jgi:hypothetical protein
MNAYQHVRRRRLLVGVVAAVAMATLALGHAIASDEPLVYDPSLDVWLPASDNAINQEAQPDLTITTGGSSLEPVEPDEPLPAAIQPEILDVDNESDTLPSSPFPPGVMRMTNVYSEGDGHVSTGVFAGALAENTSQGLLVVLKDSWDTSDQTTITRLAPAGLGSLTLTGFEGRILYFRAANRQTGKFDLDTFVLETCPITAPCGAAP